MPPRLCSYLAGFLLTFSVSLDPWLEAFGFFSGLDPWLEAFGFFSGLDPWLEVSGLFSGLVTGVVGCVLLSDLMHPLRDTWITTESSHRTEDRITPSRELSRLAVTGVVTVSSHVTV